MIRSTLLMMTLAACSSEWGLTGLSFTADAQGGLLALEGLTVEVPAGALAERVTITVVPSDGGPEGIAAWSPTWTFGPDGQVFDVPITVRMAHTGGDRPLTVFWTDEASAFRRVETDLSRAGWAVAMVDHFSAGVVGRDDDPCERDDRRPVDEDRGDDDREEGGGGLDDGREEGRDEGRDDGDDDQDDQDDQDDEGDGEEPTDDGR